MLRMLPILGASLFACCMGMFFASNASLSPPGSGVIPAALAFVAVGVLGGAVTSVVGAQERRIQELERRLRGTHDAEPGAPVGERKGDILLFERPKVECPLVCGSFWQRINKAIPTVRCGKCVNPFSHDRRLLEWLRNAIFANPAKSVQPCKIGTENGTGDGKRDGSDIGKIGRMSSRIMVLEGDLHLARPADDRANGTPIPDQDVSQCGVASRSLRRDALAGRCDAGPPVPSRCRRD